MNIIYKLTLRHMKLNKKRTLVTILGIIISVAMFTAVSVIVFSLQDALVRRAIADNGKWHAKYSDVSVTKLKVFDEDSNIDFYMLGQSLGYSKLENAENSRKPYIYVESYSDKAFENMPVSLSEGRLPTSDNELIIPDYLSADSGLDYKIGDKITLSFGNRYYSDTTGDKTILDQSYSYENSKGEDDAEFLEETGVTKEYTIVGTMKKLNSEYAHSPGYTSLTYLDIHNLTQADTINVSIYLKSLNQNSINHLNDLSTAIYGEHTNFNTNSGLFTYSAATADRGFNQMLIILAIVLFIIIMIGSTSLIYNAFAISIAERSKYLGMIASVGATKKQKQSSVFFESFIVGIISIVVGIGAGILGIAVTFYFLNPIMEKILGLNVPIRVVVNIPVLLITTLMSIITILLSAYIPARRASRISPIDAIRQSSDIKLKVKNVRTFGVTRKIFGFEAELALKNLKRFKGRYRATVFSLIISIILFLTASSYSYYLQNAYGMTSDVTSYDAEIVGSDQEDFKKLYTELSGINSVTNCTLERHLYDSLLLDNEYSLKYLTEDERKYIETQYSGGDIPDESDPYPWDEYRMGFSIISLSDESFSKYAEKINYQPKEGELNAIVVNKAVVANGMKRAAFAPMNIKIGDMLPLYNEYYTVDNTIIDREDDPYADAATVSNYLLTTTLYISKITDQMPEDANIFYNNTIANLIVTEKTMAQITEALNNSEDITNESAYLQSHLYISSSSPKTLDKEIVEVLGENRLDSYGYYNVYESQQEDAQIQILIAVFAYGFIFLISCICIANNFNTISTNISLRRREFAILRSTGMTPKAFNKMINFESIFYGIKALLYGLPISFGIMVLLYDSIYAYFSQSFSVPWGSILIAVIAVFMVVGSAMLYSTVKIKKENVIDGLRIENI